MRLMLTPRAEEYIKHFKRKSGLDDPIVGIGWGRWNHETEDHWMLGLYERSTVGSDWPGWHAIAPEFDFVVINPALLNRLEGRVLDIAEGKPKVSDDAT